MLETKNSFFERALPLIKLALPKKSATNVEQPESSSQPKMPDIPIVTPQETNDCAAHHGTTTPSDGSDSGKVDAKYVCPQSKPVCKGYKFNVNWGKCVEESGNNDIDKDKEDEEYKLIKEYLNYKNFKKILSIVKSER